MIRTSTNTVISTIPVGTSVTDLVVSKSGNRLFVTGVQVGLMVINTSTNSIAATSATNGVPYSIALSPAGTRVFVGTQIDWLEVFDTTTYVMTHVDTNAGWLNGIAFHAASNRVYVTSIDSSSGTPEAAVLVLNASNYALIDTIPVDVAPEELAVSPDGKRVYVTNPGDYSVSGSTPATWLSVRTAAVHTSRSAAPTNWWCSSWCDAARAHAPRSSAISCSRLLAPTRLEARNR